MNLPDLHYELPELNELKPNLLSLGVPVDPNNHGIVQMGVPVEEKERLAVKIVPSEITISREDGTLLQAEEVRHFLDYRAMMLAQPVAQLVLRQAEPAEVWRVALSEGVRVADPATLRRFLNVITIHSIHKQRKQQLAMARRVPRNH